MRVLCFCEKWESGGVEAFVTTLYECMDRTGMQIDIAACTVSSGPYDARLAAMGIRVIPLGTGVRDVRANLRAFGRLMRSNAYDVVHLNVYEGLALLFAREARRASAQRVIVHSHNNDLRPSRLRWAKLALHRVCVGLLGGETSARWAPSEAAGRFMFGGRSFDLVRNGIVPERFAFDSDVRAAVRRKLGVADGEPVMGCVGRLCDQKNQRFLVELLPLIPQARLVLVGEDDGDGSYGAGVLDCANRLGVSDRLTLLGRRDDVAPLYQAMDVLCMPSLFEGLGIVAIEAQASGLPVLASPAVPSEARVCASFGTVPPVPAEWARQVEAVSGCARSSQVGAVAAAGYDMRETAAWVRGEYEDA